MLRVCKLKSSTEMPREELKESKLLLLKRRRLRQRKLKLISYWHHFSKMLKPWPVANLKKSQATSKSICTRIQERVQKTCPIPLSLVNILLQQLKMNFMDGDGNAQKEGLSVNIDICCHKDMSSHPRKIVNLTPREQLKRLKTQEPSKKKSKKKELPSSSTI